jgi:hypothetical protein
MNTKALLLSAVGICLAMCAAAQEVKEVQEMKEVKKPKRHFIQLSYTDQHYFNSEYIHTDHLFPEPMTAPNTRGYNFAVNYQYVTKFGLTLNGSVQYGKQKHLIKLDYDLTNMDAKATYSLRDRTFHTSYRFEPVYLSNRVMIGYIKALPFKAAKGWYAEAKAGIAYKLMKGTIADDMGRHDQHRIWYKLDAPNHWAGSIIADVNPNLGRNEEWNLTKPLYQRPLHTFEGYLGLRRDLDNGLLKYFAIGAECTRTLKNRNQDFLSVSTYTLTLHSGEDFYYDKQLSVGLLIGAGFAL